MYEDYLSSQKTDYSLRKCVRSFHKNVQDTIICSKKLYNQGYVIMVFLWYYYIFHTVLHFTSHEKITGHGIFRRHGTCLFKILKRALSQSKIVYDEGLNGELLGNSCLIQFFNWRYLLNCYILSCPEHSYETTEHTSEDYNQFSVMIDSLRTHLIIVFVHTLTRFPIYIYK